MNTVKRWLAGFLSFAMIFTSSAFANVGMVYAQRVDPANKDKKVKLTIGETTTYWDGFDNALMSEINSEESLKKSVTVDLLENVISNTTISLERPLVINFNGNSFDNDIETNDNICAGAFFSGNAQTGINYAVHDPVTRYVWGYNDKYGAKNDKVGFLWYITGTEGVCANCYGKAGAETAKLTPAASEGKGRTFIRKYNDSTGNYVGYERFNYVLGQYEFWAGDEGSEELVAAQKTDGYTVADGPKFVTDGTIIRHNANGEPIVDVTVLKNLDGSVLNDPTIELTKATYIEELYNISSALNYKGEPGNFTRADLTPPTCSKTGKTLYKVIVKDPKGTELSHCYIVDEQAPTLKHEVGELAKIQLLTRVGYGFTEEEAIAAALQNGYTQNDIVEKTHGRYESESYWDDDEEVYYPTEPVESGGDVYYFAWAWVDVEGSEASVDQLNLGDFASGALADDGTFKYRPVYYCRFMCDEEPGVKRLIDGNSSDPVQPLANETISKKNPKTGAPKYSTCIVWNYEGFSVTKNEYDGNGKLKKTSKNTYKPVSVNKPEVAYSHDLENATNKEIIRTANCKDDGIGTFKCPICNEEPVWYTFKATGDAAKHTYGKYPESRKPTQGEIMGYDFDEIHNISDVSDGAESTVTVYPTCEEPGGTYKWCVGPYELSVDDFYASYDIYPDDLNTSDDPTAKPMKVLVTPELQRSNHYVSYYPGYGPAPQRTGDFEVGQEITIYPYDISYNFWGTTYTITVWGDETVEKLIPGMSQDLLEKYKYVGEVLVGGGHWVLQGDPTPATGHKLSTEVVVTDDCWSVIDQDGYEYGYWAYDVAAAGVDYIFEASQKCLNTTDAQHSLTVRYHSMAGTDTETDKYSAVTISKADSGSNCISNAKTTWTVKGLTQAGTNNAPVTKTLEKENSTGKHKIKVNKFVWANNLESAEATGTCEICTRQASDFATITKKTAENGLTTFTATYGEYTDTKTGYSLNGAKVSFDASQIKDGNRVLPEDGISQEVPDVTVSFKNSDGTSTVLNPDLYEVTWDYDHQTKTAIAFVDWTENIKKQPGYIYTGFAYGVAQVDAGMQIEPAWKYDLNGVENKWPKLGIVADDYDPANTYKLISAVIPNDATVKYAVLNKAIDQGESFEEIQKYQRKIEKLNFDKDEVVVHDAGEYYVYAQITKDGYTTFTGYVGCFVIGKPEIYVRIDDASVTVGEDPLLKLKKKAYEYDSEDEMVVDWADFVITTDGGQELTNLDAGDYRLNVQSKNYTIHTENKTYIGTLKVNPKEDATIAAEKVAEQLKSAQTDDELAAAYAAFAALTPDQQKIVKSDSAAAALLEKAKAAYDAKQAADKKAAEKKAAEDAANAAIAAANAYASDATIKALIDALNAALKQGDTAAIQKATADLNNAVAAKKAQPAKKSTPTAKISTKSKTYKAKDLKKKAKSFKIKYSKTSGSGKATFKKSSGSKKLKVSKAGKITVKKGTKKGTYKIKVKMTVAANSKFNAKTVKKTIKVKVK